ncbi:MAG: phosphotransferase [Propionicimonas sp.]|uniref:phosphotransferase n=1 Tax=Propionicimonas sp. TaxID=1955623 RepID=UPI003D0B5019
MSTASAWQEHLRGARWFGGKGLGARVARITALPWYTAAGAWPAVRSELAEIAYEDGRTETYQLVVSYVPAGTAPAGLSVGTTTLPGLGDVDVLDAPSHPESAAALVRALRDTPGPGMDWHDASPVDADAEIRLFTGEQSNTTIVVGATTLLKLFRKLEPGRNLDAEVLAALSGSGITPDLYGTLSADGYDLAMFCQRITGITDGWVYATDACAAGRDISVECHQLGAELRDLHARLAMAFGTSTRPGDEVTTDMVHRFDRAADQVRELDAYRRAARLLFGAPSGHDLATQRVHGDFHLGQVLHREQGRAGEWVIIDFEGEPLKTLAERRAFDSVWRDVAGLLRSLDYARSAHADPDGAAARQWCAAAREAFLAGYSGRHRAEPALLRAYELDKAVYEVVYEVRNRPDWAHIPWRAVQDEARRVSLDPPAPTQEEQ